RQPDLLPTDPTAGSAPGRPLPAAAPGPALLPAGLLRRLLPRLASRARATRPALPGAAASGRCSSPRPGLPADRASAGLLGACGPAPRAQSGTKPIVPVGGRGGGSGEPSPSRNSSVAAIRPASSTNSACPSTSGVENVRTA